MTVSACFVVAVAGASGAGKTTLVRGLAGAVEGAVALHFDHYLEGFPEDEAAWLDAGADPDVWSTPRLAEHLAALRRGEPFRDGGGATIGPARCAVVEEPMGRGRRQLRELVDFVLYLDLPPEVALARRVRRDVLRAMEPGNHERGLSYLLNYMDEYLYATRRAYEAGRALALPLADVVLDGTRPADELLESARRAVAEARAGAV